MPGERFKKFPGELFHKKGNFVWVALGEFMTVEPKRGRPFGKVLEDSLWPDEWVSIEVWDQSKLTTMDNKINGAKGKVQCPKRLQ